MVTINGVTWEVSSFVLKSAVLGLGRKKKTFFQSHPQRLPTCKEK